MTTNKNSIDQLHEQLTKGVEWSGKNAKWVVSLILVLIVLGVGVSLYGYFDDKKEADLQEKYYRVERAYGEKKREFTQKNITTFKTEDLSKDLGSIPEDFEKVLAQYPKSRAGHMAALNLVEIYSNYKMNDKALAIFDKVGHLDGADLTSALLLFQKGTVLTNADKCSDAITVWDQVIAAKKMAYFRREAQLRKALCLEKTGDQANAEKIYNELSQLKNPPKEAVKDEQEDRETNAQIATEAQKYLRLMKMKKGS